MMRSKQNDESTKPRDTPSGHDSDSRSVFRVGIMVLLVAFVVRGFVCFLSLDQYAADPDGYQAFAYVLSTEGSFASISADGTLRPSAFRPPLYPYILSVMPGEFVGEFPNVQFSPLAVACLHTILGCLTAVCTFLAGRRLIGGKSPLPSILAAAVVIVDPILLQQSGLVMTETLATAITSVIVWWWVRCDVGIFRGRTSTRRLSNLGSALGLGVLISLAFLCRPTFLVWGVLLCLCVAFRQPESEQPISTARGRVTQAAIVGLLLMLTVGAWSYRNQRAVGHPVWATTHGGYTLLLGNNPPFYDYLRNGKWGTVWDADGFLAAYHHRFDDDMTSPEFWNKDFPETQTTNSTNEIPFTEHDDDRLSYNAAVATIRREPMTFLHACLVRVARLWTPVPHRTQGRSTAVVVGVGAFYVALYLAILVAIGRSGSEFLKSRWWPALMLVITLSCVHAFYWSNMRMRAPAMPVLGIAAAAAFRPKK